MHRPDASRATRSPAIAIRRKGRGRRRGWAAYGLVWLSTLLFTAAAYASGTSLGNSLIHAGTIVVPFAIWLALAALVIPRRHKERAGTVRVQGDTLTLERGGEQLSIPKSSISTGWIVPGQGSHAVGLATKDGDEISIQVKGEQAAEALLERVGVDASRRSFRLSWGETLFLDLLTALLGPVAAGGAAVAFGTAIASLSKLSGCVFFAVLSSLFVAVRALLGPASVVIGSDGIRYGRAFVTRFLAWERLRAVTWTGFYLDMELTDGTHKRIKTRWLTQEQGAAFVRRIDDAKQVWAKSAGEPRALASLDRGSRPLEQWRAGLRQLLSGDDYRRAALGPEDLLRVVEDPSAPVERRVGAAIAISSSGDEGSRERVRIAADASASPHFRIALEKTLSDELDAEALERAVQEAAGPNPRAPPAH